MSKVSEHLAQSVLTRTSYLKHEAEELANAGRIQGSSREDNAASSSIGSKFRSEFGVNDVV